MPVRPSSFLRALALSVLFHGMLWVVLMKGSFPRAPHSVPEKISFSFETRAQSPRTSSRASKHRSSAKAAQNSKDLRRFLPPRRTFTTASPENSLEDWRDPNAYGKRNIFSTNTDAKTDAFYRTLYQAIDQQIRNDSLLSEYNQHGIVYLRFSVSPDGRILRDTLEASASNRILKVRSAKALRRGLSEPLRDTFQLSTTEPITVTSRFIWKDQANCGALEGHSGPFLTFCRQVPTTRKDFSALGQAKSTAAILLSPEGPFGWAEAFEKYGKKKYRYKTKFDPFETERMDPDYDL